MGEEEMNRYILNNEGDPAREDNIEAFAEWHDKANRTIAKDNIGDVLISTIFLAYDYSWGEGEPILWETLIFGGEHDLYQERYTSKEDALVGHLKAVKLVKGED